MCSSQVSTAYVVVRQEWLVSEYFAVLAERIFNTLRDEALLLRALSADPSMATEAYEIIVTGHSLAGGVACVLSIMLKQFYDRLHCYAYSPPNSIFGATCTKDTKAFITTVVLGKDIIPRLGHTQVEAFRKNIINGLKSCRSSKISVGQPFSSCGALSLISFFRGAPVVLTINFLVGN
ncbi:hypothetical protein HELRODRAFT_179988 [Helobdella robusta]|uniref:sn-1-specific diacylglycerol lipase n=1 Tax=Helobdella robusta TaxID=6412 RepID=T1FFB2_HELRO|nr:hypothetical protein HELRODRAFT_179988 [Helobdella robusta]ESN94886.1 hypothetical protein HELRODRAFT_179988 [Helobdella robusta]